MPVSPKTVAAYVHSSDPVDEAIVLIDDILDSPREKDFRFGEWETDDDWYHIISLNHQLDLAQKEELRQAYLNVGWPIVQVSDFCTVTVVRLFVNRNSKYVGAK